MSEQYDAGQTPTIEVRVFRHGELVQRTLCESEEEAARVLEQWNEVDDVTFLVDDLGSRHAPSDVLAPEAPETVNEDYPHEPAVEPEVER